MIKHIVSWRFSERAEGRDRLENVALISERLRALPDLIPGIIDFEVVTPQPGRNASFDLMLYSTFPDAAAQHAYAVHPAHQEVVPLLGAVREQSYVFDYDSDAL